MSVQTQEKPIPLRRYLVLRALNTGSSLKTAIAAAQVTETAHPEWDRTVLRTWHQWERIAGRERT